MTSSPAVNAVSGRVQTRGFIRSRGDSPGARSPFSSPALFFTSRLTSEPVCHGGRLLVGRNGDEVGNVATLKAISVPLASGLLGRVVARGGAACRVCHRSFKQINLALD